MNSYLTNLYSDNITVVRMTEDGQISLVDQIYAGASQRLIAANKSANRIFITKINPDTSEMISGYELISGKLVCDIYLDDIKYFSTLIFSPDGNILIAADSLNKKLFLIDSRLCSVIKTINTAGSPTDLSFDKSDLSRVYVTLSGSNMFCLLDLESGAVLNNITTGNSPGAIFWDREYTQVGFSSRSDLTYTIVNKINWTSATSGREIAGQFVVSVCWSNSSDYILWAMDYMLGTLYVPNWQQTSKIFNEGGRLVKIIKPIDSRFLLMLNARQLVTVEMNL